MVIYMPLSLYLGESPQLSHYTDRATEVLTIALFRNKKCGMIT